MADGEHSGETRAQFKAMTESTQNDWMIISQAAMHFSSELPQRLEAHLMLLKGDCGGFQVDRLEHSLQTATRAHRAGKDEEYVVCALLHDIGDILGPRNHADIGAAILHPYVSEANHWMLANHGIFQGYYFFHHLGLDRDGHVLAADDLVADLDANAVNAAVAFPADEPGADGDFREANQRVADAAAAHPGRIIPFCRLNPAAPFAAALAAADASGARGIKLHPVAQRFRPEGEECVVVVREATDRGWPVLFHAGFGARPLGDAFARLLDQVPDACLILAHGGRGDHRALAAATAGHPDVLFDTSIAALPDLVTLPPERIVFGSDRPYGDHAQALHLVGLAARVAGWDDTALRGVLATNLLRRIGPVSA